MELLIGAAIVLGALWLLAPLFGAEDARSKGLTAVQTLCALAGIVLVAEWYFVERPDAARLKFDQTVSAARLPGSRALVIVEINISNVGGHADEFKNLPYRIYVQQVAPLSAKLQQSIDTPAPNGMPRVDGADSWLLLAYRAAGEDAGPKLPKTDPGLATVIAPGESENLYYRAAVSCSPGLHVSVSSRFQKPLDRWDRIRGNQPVWWIKQSFLDLTDTCKAKGKVKTQ